MADINKYSLFLSSISSVVESLRIITDNQAKLDEIQKEYIKNSVALNDSETIAINALKYIPLISDVNNRINDEVEKYNSKLCESIEYICQFIATLAYTDNGCISWIEECIELLKDVVTFKSDFVVISSPIPEMQLNGALDKFYDLQGYMSVEKVVQGIQGLKQDLNNKANVGKK